MNRINAHRLAKIACDELMNEDSKASRLRVRCEGPDADMTRAEVMEGLGACAQRATAIWKASELFIAPPLAGAKKNIATVAAMYRVVMRCIATHVCFVANR